LIHKSN